MFVIQVKPTPVTRTVERLVLRYRLYVATLAASYYSEMLAQARAGREWACVQHVDGLDDHFNEQERDAAEGLAEAHRRQAVAKSDLMRLQ